MKRVVWCCALLLLPTLLCASPLPRKILGLYQAAGDRDSFYTNVHQHAAMPLNHLGLDVVLRATNLPLPAANSLDDYVGVVTWFNSTGAIADPAAYCDWLHALQQRGKKIVMLDDPGFFPANDSGKIPSACQTVMQTLGVTYRGAATTNPFFFDVQLPNPALMEFERKLLQTEHLPYVWLEPRTTDSSLHIWASATRRDLAGSRSALVFVNRAGGVAYTGYPFYYQPEVGRAQWRIDPFQFFRDALGVAGRPIPDTTTAFGRRIFFSHIDGDGIFNQSLQSPGDVAGTVILRDIIRRFPDLPITVSIIAGYLDLPAYTNNRAMELYRALFSAPNVEAAAHGYAHPLIWAKRTVALDIPNYTFNADKEIRGAVELTNALLNQLQIPKQVALYQWTGDCVVSESDMAIAESLGIPHLNGGDSRFDHYRTSYAYVAPASISKGSARQTYTAAPNENIYTNLWKGPHYGYLDVQETFARTESPRRVKPLNVYFHFYSGERNESLIAVQRAYDAALAETPFPMFASRYAQWVRDALTASIEPDAGGYIVRHNGSARTVRFDLADYSANTMVDLDASRGVLGYTQAHEHLYVALDSNTEQFVRLTTTPPTHPYLVDATVDIDRGSSWWQWRAHGMGAAHITWGGLQPGRAYITRVGMVPQRLMADDRGRATLRLPAGRTNAPLTIQLRP